MSDSHKIGSVLMLPHPEILCNFIPEQSNPDPGDSDEQAEQIDPSGACAAACFEEPQATDVENASLQDILDLLIKINNR